LSFAPDGTATRIEMRTVFPTKELRDQAVEKYRAIGVSLGAASRP